MTETLLARRLDLVANMRRLVGEMATAAADEQSLNQAAALIGQAIEVLDHAPHRPGYTREIEGALTGLGAHGERGPFTGALHVFAPVFSLDVSGEGDDREVTGLATYGAAYEGMAGFVQGGFIAATFDEILALTQSGARRVTADLQISYRASAPLHAELTYSARLNRIEGRKAFVDGMLCHGNTICALAKGLFIAPRVAYICERPEQ